ncbi:MAG: hypothetical protein ACLRPS_13530 [Paraprevotella clara]|uniref:hypothetical protein n=1 Tax=Paraprevotella clara TaxID=454154 RepID=UPI00399581D6
MKHIAFHKVYWPSGRFAVMPVITVDEKGFYQSYCILTGEMPAVIWNGGIGLLLPPDVVPQPSDCIAALLRKANPDIGPDALRLWRADGLPADADLLTPVVRWYPVF